MNLEILKHEDFGAIRVQQVAGAPWFVAKDVCDALGLANPSDRVKTLEENERAMLNIGQSSKGNQVRAWCLNESGLYQLIFQSRKPQAKAFTRWVTGEVLPAIRKEGRYEAERRPLHQISYSSNRMEALSAAVMDVEDKTQRVEIWNAATALLHSCMVVKEEAAV